VPLCRLVVSVAFKCNIPGQPGGPLAPSSHSTGQAYYSNSSSGTAGTGYSSRLNYSSSSLYSTTGFAADRGNFYGGGRRGGNISPHAARDIGGIRRGGVGVGGLGGGGGGGVGGGGMGSLNEPSFASMAGLSGLRSVTAGDHYV
jgi:hypothetical protein